MPLSAVTTKVGSGATPRGGKESYHPTGVPLIRSQNVRFEGFDRDGLVFLDNEQARDLDGVVVEANDVLLNITGASIGRVTVAPDALAGSRVNQHVCIVRPQPKLLPRFLSHYLASPSVQAFIMAEQSGVTRQALTKAKILDFEVPVPTVDTQSAIVAAIDSHFSRLDAATATLERVQRNLERYRASVLKAAVEGRLVPTEAELAKKEGRSYEPASVLLKRILAERRLRWEEAELAKLKAKGKPPTDDRWKARYEEPVAPDTDGLPELPEGWCWASVDQLATEVCYGTSAKTGDDSAGVPIIRMGNIVNGALDCSDMKFLPEEHDEFPHLLLEPGDILFNRTNSAELVGKTAVYSGNPSPCSFASYLIRVRVAGGCRPEFLSTYINSASGRRWIASVLTQQVGQANVNGSKLRACVLPLPPAPEQVRIVDAVDTAATTIRRLVGDVAAVRARVARLRQSVLKCAFEGRLA
ncbi:MAG: restriction endonuclease subunit S [Planctomycetes bacterium]|nr:restriction endonuclease subunit S [Planctomycetota bacterium]